ncbi:MAG TPA: ATP-binding cassette domain-containing protein [Solirubrobacteraceae bacterium]|jgi:ABC-type lipoprotein export system ATPase subunit|nr:ATP-binding cassette domain-containing protein [Solirubrobacteraceae bacterium]
MTDALLSLRSVSKRYWRGAHELRVLTDVSMEMSAGEFVAVWGRRGAGKTTLLKIAVGLEVPDGGSVHFAGQNLAGMSESAHARLMRERIGWIRRAGPRSDLAMLDYVALPLLVEHGQRRARSRAYDALARVGMSECSGQRWDSLSDGERALVGIAHGIVRRPRLLLVDDPTANLGVREREDVNELLRSLTADEGLAVLMTVPGMPAAMGTDELKVLSGGRLLTQPRDPAPRTNVIDFPRQRSA